MKSNVIVMYVRRRTESELKHFEAQGASWMTRPLGSIGEIQLSVFHPIINEHGYLIRWEDTTISFASNWQVVKLNDPDADVTETEDTPIKETV